jgi:uncharacterized membrane protein SpoIIM required for sporulation
MNRDLFERQHGTVWQQAETLLAAFESGRRTPSAGRFPDLYRKLCHHLALARARQYGADLEQRLNRLALRGHQRLYGERPASGEAVAVFACAGFPRLVRRDAGLFWVCFLLLFGPLLGMAAAVAAEPDLVFSVLAPPQVAAFEEMYSPASQRERGSRSDFLMFGVYIYNNIGIAFRTFAMGIFLGVGSIFILVYNGIVIGAVAGHLHNAGYGETFYPFVIAHGAFELPAIVLAGMTGMRLGLALLAPGRKSRLRSLQEAARGSVPIIYGTTAMLVAAAFIEAFWSSSVALPAALRYLAGAAAWVAVGLYFLLAGRRHGP